MKVVVSGVGWTSKDGAEHRVEQGETLPSDVPADKVEFWQKTGAVTGKTPPADKK